MTIEYFWLEAIWILALIFANGFFAASEIAVITMRKSRIDALLERGVKAAAVVARLKEDPDRFLATVQIGVTVISSLASAIGGAAAIGYLKPQIAAAPFPFVARWAEAIALVIVVLPISYLSLVLGELVPKSLALRYSEQIACFVARPIEFLARERFFCQSINRIEQSGAQNLRRRSKRERQLHFGRRSQITDPRRHRQRNFQ